MEDHLNNQGKESPISEQVDVENVDYEEQYRKNGIPSEWDAEDSVRTGELCFFSDYKSRHDDDDDDYDG